MIYHCDALLPAEARYLSQKYRDLSRYLNIYKIEPAYAEELCIFMSTPGLAHVHVRHMLHWDAQSLMNARILLKAKPVDPTLVQRNAESITLDDGRAMLVSLLDGKPGYSQYPPLAVTRYLQHRRKHASAVELAEEFRTTPARIRRWWLADVFDPLSGRMRPRHSLSRNRPIATTARRVGVAI